MKGKLAAGSLLFFAFFTILFGQRPSPNPAVDIEKLKNERRTRLLESIQTDAAQLRLPENRAIVNSKLGATIWKTDQERGRKLFNKAIDDLIAAQQFAESSKNPGRYYDLLNSQSLRPQVLNAIAAADAEFALECLYRSRPSAVEQAMSTGPSSSKISNNYGNQSYLMQNEVNLELRFARMAAEQKPEKALAILKDNIRKKLSSETLNLLRSLIEKDPTAASELGNDVISRLNSRSFMTDNQINYELVNLSNSMIYEHVREHGQNEKTLGLEDAGIRSLTEKTINLYLTKAAQMGYVPLQQLEPAARKYFPAMVEKLKSVSQNTRWRGDGLHFDPEYTKLIEGNPSAETLVSAAKKFPVETRRSIYLTAANKFAEAGHFEDGLAILNEYFEGDSLETAVNGLRSHNASLMIQKGEFGAAEALILEFDDSQRNQALISLAYSVYNANPEENRSRAIDILNRVRAYLPEKPENQEEMSQLFSLMGAMASIEPAEAFRNFEPIVDLLNQLADASALINAFQNNNVRQGEFILTNGSQFGVYIDQGIIRSLGQKDFDRAWTLVDSFSRREMRILTRLDQIEYGL